MAGSDVVPKSLWKSVVNQNKKKLKSSIQGWALFNWPWFQPYNWPCQIPVIWYIVNVKIIDKFRFILSLNHKKIQHPKKVSLWLNRYLPYFHYSLKVYDTPGMILSAIDCKGPLSVSLWQDWASAVATFTENYWDLGGLSFYFGGRNLLGGAKFRETKCTLYQQMTLYHKWIFKRLSSLQLLQKRW